MCLLIWTVFSGERCGPWASCFWFWKGEDEEEGGGGSNEEEEEDVMESAGENEEEDQVKHSCYK